MATISTSMISHTGRRTPLGLSLSAIIIAAMAAIPLLAICAAFFTQGGSDWAHLATTTLPSYMANTAALMVITGCLSFAIGVGTAWLMTAATFPGQKLYEVGLVLPLAAPSYIIAYVYTDLLAISGPVQSWIRSMFGIDAAVAVLPNIRSLWGAGLMLALVLYPYVYLLARAAFARQPGSQYHAARSLGCGPTKAFLSVALPGARPAIAGGLALVLMETLADFGVADYFAIPTFSTGIYRTWVGLGDIAAALKLAAVLLVFVCLLVAFEGASRRGKTDDGARQSALLTKSPLGGWQAIAASCACAAPILLGFLIPTAALLHYALTSGDTASAGDFLRYSWNSCRVAVITCLIGAALAVLLAYAQRLSKARPIGWSIRFATLGYALPGTLLAVGILGPLGSLDQHLTDALYRTGVWPGGLVLSGTTALLIYAYLIRFLTVSFNAVSGSLARIAPATDAAARTLGAGPSDVLLRVHIPMIRPGLAAACLLVFVDVMRELPATLILRPFNFETLATRVYRLASDERLAEASTASLAIIAIGLIPTVLITRSALQREGR